MAINEELQLGRAKNAVLTFLEGRLSVPKIYIDANWDGQHVDVLAINRDGIGDVHAVLLFALKYIDGSDQLDDMYEWRMEKELIDQLEKIPAQYKYVGIVDVDSGHNRTRFNLAPSVQEKTFAPDGLGRVGFLKIDVPADGENVFEQGSQPWPTSTFSSTKPTGKSAHRNDH
jgi:hypothetical protein